MKTSEIMIEQLARKRRIALLESDLHYLNTASNIKVTRFSDDVGGKGESLEDKYWKLIENKQLKEIELLKEKMEFNRIDKMLDLLQETNPHGRNAIEMFYFKGKEMPIIADTIGFSISHSWKILRDAEIEFEKIFNLSSGN